MATRILSVVGTRSDLMKIAPLLHSFTARSDIESCLLAVSPSSRPWNAEGSHEDLGVPQPQHMLETNGGSNVEQTATIMGRLEPIMLRENPTALLVIGHGDAALAGALTASKRGVPVIRIDAGLRNFDRSAPEEINRVVTDVLSDILFVSERSAVANLAKEGVDRRKIHFAGSLTIDWLNANRSRTARSDVLEKFDLKPGGYAVLSLHRPAIVDRPGTLNGICDAIQEIQKRHTVVFPVHPGTRPQLDRAVGSRFKKMPNVRLLEPLAYPDFMRLITDATAVLTDSGVVQEEAAALSSACLTLRYSTERPATVECGSNQIVGLDPNHIVSAYRRTLASKATRSIPDMWDGKAAGRIADAILAWRRGRTASRSQQAAYQALEMIV